MYFNDVHILYYVFIGLLGLIVGYFINWCNVRLPEYKKIFSKEFFTNYKKEVKTNYILIAINVIIYLILLYLFGIQKTLLDNMDLIKYITLTPILLSVLSIDYKLKIIPNRLNLTLFELGLVFAFIFGISNINIAIDMFLGMLVGGGIFLLITVIGGLIARKEAMGFGDVKLMGGLRIIFWTI